MGSLFTSLDLYCERTDASFWSEPFNALTNLLIVAAGLWGLTQVRARRTGLFAELLCWGVVIIGIGSLLFHTTAIELTKWADIIPIAVFTIAMTLFGLRRYGGLSWPQTWVSFILYVLVIGTVTALVPAWLREATNGTTGYLPAFGAFVFCGIVALLRGSAAGWYCLACSAILLVGFFFRAIDPEVCDGFALGTHFLWHTSIAVLLAVNLLGVAKFGAARG